MIHTVFSEYMTTVKTGGSGNSPYAAANILFSIDEKIQAAIFEMGMSHHGVISSISKIVNPDIAAITNIGYAHIQYLKTREGILNAKLEILDGMDENGYILINKDDEMLSKAIINKCHKVTYSMYDNTADYYAQNIKSSESAITFEIVAGATVTPVVLNCIGEHNVYNALIAFISGILANIPTKVVVNGLANFKTSGIRQNVYEFGEKTVIADCYNASPETMESALKMLAQRKVAEHGRRVAVLADMLELGDMSVELHKKVGRALNKYDIDMLFCYGNDSRHILNEVVNPRCQSLFFKTPSALAEVLSLNLKDGDVILFKGSHAMKLEEVMEKVFKSNPSPVPAKSPLYDPKNDIKDIMAKSYILFDLNTSDIILEKDTGLKVRPASLTMILTLISIIESANLDDIVVVDKDQLSYGIIYKKWSNIGLVPGQKYLLRDLLYAFFIASGNDGANAVCKHVFGNIEKAVKYMNEKAKEIGATESSFVNVHGMDNDNHYTTARDMLKIVRYALTNTLFRDIMRQTPRADFSFSGFSPSFCVAYIDF